MLASNYLDVPTHPLFPEVEDLIMESKVTPAEVGEQLMKNEDPDIALQGLIQFLAGKQESDAAKAREAEMEAAAAAAMAGVKEKGKGENEKSEKRIEREIKMIM